MYKSLVNRIVKVALTWAIVFPSCYASSHAADHEQILVTVDDEKITSRLLEETVNSSPYAVQFNTMSADEQASLRGDLLNRLVASKLLIVEAKKQKIDQDKEFQSDVALFKKGLLYRYYMDKLRESIKIPDEIRKKLRTEFQGQSDAYTLAKAAYIADRFKGVKLLTIRNLKDKYHVKIYEQRVDKNLNKDTVLLDGDGIIIRYGDIVDTSSLEQKPEKDWIMEQLYKAAELELVAKAAMDEGVNVDKKVAAYKETKLAEFLLRKLEKQWIPDEKTLKDYFDKHPGISKVPERWHIGQIVLKTEGEARIMKKRIENGESLFRLAAQYSIDPYGRAHSGDIGWVKQGQGNPKIEKIVEKLKNEEVSPIIKTRMGYHIVMILDRRPGSTRTFSGFRDKIRQILISEKMADYINGLQKSHKVVWNLIQQKK